MARSPNYPNYDLTASLQHAQKIYGEDMRNKVSRAIVAKHLGHESLSGPALGKIGALRAYGLLEGNGDELRVSENAIAALRAPPGSDEYKIAMERLAMNPALFQAIRREYPSKPSKESLVWWLEKQGFTGTAALIAADSYLSTIALLDSLGAGQKPEEQGSTVEIDTSWDQSAVDQQPMQRIKAADGERVAFTEEGRPGQYLKLIASGEIDDTLLEALEDYVKRQRKRLGITPMSAKSN